MTTSSDLGADLRARFGDRLASEVPLAPYTTFRVGGPAEWFLQVGSSREMIDAVRIVARHGVATTVLGGGSNVLVADSGVRGLVVRVHGGEVVPAGPDRVRADAGVTINALVRWTITRGLAGLAAWAGTPGTVGGAVHGNAHFQGQLIGDLVTQVQVVDRHGDLATVAVAEMAFGYEASRLRSSGEWLAWAEFALSPGHDPATLRPVARASLAFRKRTQPLHLASAGCVFQNPVPGRDRLPEGVPWSAGALVDRAGLRGFGIGGARVSPVHANFVVNEGGATARDIRQVIEHCRDEVARRFGVMLRDEIVYVGDVKR